MINVCVLVGRLAADPVLRYSKDGSPYTSFTLALKKDYSPKEADFFECVCFGKTAEASAQYLAKGKKVGVVGRISIITFKGRDGVTRKKPEIQASMVKFIDGYVNAKNGKSENNSEWDSLGQEIDVSQARSLTDNPFEEPF